MRKILLCGMPFIAAALAGCGHHHQAETKKTTDDGPAVERQAPGTTDDGPAVERVPPSANG